MTEQHQFFVPKTTGTFADALQAFGLAAILESLLPETDRTVRLRDVGPWYVLDVTTPLRDAWVQAASYQAYAPFIKTARSGEKLPADFPATMVRDYQDERDRFFAFIRAPEALRKDPEQRAKLAPRPDYHVMAFIAERRLQALGSYNELVLRWHRTRAQFGVNLRHLLLLAATPDGDADEVRRSWERAMKAAGVQEKSTATLIQALNPSQGKGLNEPKASRLAMGNLIGFWLAEYLKIVGLFVAAAPRLVRGTDDYKAYTLAPVNLRVSAAREVMHDFQEALWSETAIKSDVLASLKLARTFLQHSEPARQGSLYEELFGGGPEDFVADLYSAYYKSLGQSSAVMNLSFVHLPAWMRVNEPGDVEAYLAILTEHEEVIQTIDEDRGGYELLLRYRDFLSGRDWTAFFDFQPGWTSYLMRELQAQHWWVRPFSATNLERLIMEWERATMENSKPLLPIVQSQGFKNLARAIRQSTIRLQYLYNDPNKRPAERRYEVRYGLAQELKRKMPYKDEFVAVLAEFAQSYNAENARVYERTGGKKVSFRRFNILESDLEEVIRYVDEYGSETVGSLLIAFGYARSLHEESSEAGAPPEPTAVAP